MIGSFRRTLSAKRPVAHRPVPTERSARASETRKGGHRQLELGGVFFFFFFLPARQKKSRGPASVAQRRVSHGLAHRDGNEINLGTCPESNTSPKPTALSFRRRGASGRPLRTSVYGCMNASAARCEMLLNGRRLCAADAAKRVCRAGIHALVKEDLREAAAVVAGSLPVVVCSNRIKGSAPFCLFLFGLRSFAAGGEFLTAAFVMRERGSAGLIYAREIRGV